MNNFVYLIGSYEMWQHFQHAALCYIVTTVMYQQFFHCFQHNEHVITNANAL